METINCKKLFYLYFGFVIIVLIVGCKASRVLLPELHEDDTNWLVSESVHYFIYYRLGSPAAEDIEEISENLDSCFTDVLNQLEVNYEAKIHYYLYNSKEDLQRNTRRDYFGFASREFQCAAQIYSSRFTKLNAHETAHIIVCNTIGMPKLYFLEEGIAEAVAHAHDEWSPGRLSLHCKAKMCLYLGRLFSLDTLADNDRFKEIYHSESGHDYYVACGSFVRYLIDRYGLAKFKFLLPRAGENNYKKIFQEIYGKNIHDFEKEWHEFLRNY